jgi:hypothetical protein
MIIRRTVTILCLLAIFICLTLPVYASQYHEDPDAAEETFSGLSLLVYYSGVLDLVPLGEPTEIESALGKMPFASIPQSLQKVVNDLSDSGIGLSRSMAGLFTQWQQYSRLVDQYRLNEADELGKQISGTIPRIRGSLASISKSVEIIGGYLKIDALPAESELKRIYNEVTQKIQQLGDMLDPISLSLLDTREMQQKLKTTSISLSIAPTDAFVGDEVGFAGALSSQGEPLAGRDIAILLEGTLLLTARTDSAGFFGGNFQVPYRYIPQMDVQAIYYPEDKDTGLYLGSSSPVSNLAVRFYQAALKVHMNGQAYPGKELEIEGNFDYAQAPPFLERRVEVYLDDVLMAQSSVQGSFIQKVGLDPRANTGKHSLILSSPPEGRYAPVTAGLLVEVALAVPILDLDAPKIALIPGNPGLAGRLHSKMGPLKNASIDMEIGRTRASVLSAQDGSFETRIGMGMGLSFLGWQKLIIRIQPQEPWNAPLTLTKNIFLINLSGCALLVVFLAAIGYYLPRRSRAWLSHRQVTTNHGKAALSSVALPEKPVAQRSSSSGYEKFSGPVFDQYRLALSLVQRITRAILKPQQTLREFAKENSQAMGPLSKYFMEFTQLIERLLYSKHGPDRQDLEKSRQLSANIEEGGRDENV